MSDTIKTLNSRKSTGPKIIPVKMMKTIKDEILIPQSNLINISFNIGIISNICNLARVVPIMKGEVRLLCNNYRPIFLLSNIGKMIEKLMDITLNQFLESQNNLN